MSIGIVTFTYGDNFGQRLQNFALQEYLKKYDENVLTLPQKKPPKSKKTYIREIKKNIFHPIKAWDNHKRHMAFQKFDKTHIKYYKDVIGENQIPDGLNDIFDFFVCGSDQIWSPFSADVNSTMFLTFAKQEKRVAYAPSIASEYIPDDKKELYKDYWQGFNEISVREANLKEYIENITGVKTTVHIDPTLLHSASFWNEAANIPECMPNKKYIFCYFLGESKYIGDMAAKYNNKDYQVVDIMNDKSYYAISPTEFLGLIKNSEFVLTDSYHGTLFSIIFHKPFIIVERDGAVVNMSSRFKTITKMFNISDRYNTVLDVKDIYKIDFKYIDSVILKKQTETKDYFDRVFNMEREQ